MDLSIILPVFNEEKVIQPTLTEIEKYLKNLDLNYEIIIVNDGSTDQTKKIVADLNLPNWQLISYQKNLGKGYAVKKGMLRAKGDYLLFLDADYSTPIDYLENFLENMKENNYDIVIGSRALPDSNIVIHQKKHKEFFGKLGNKLIRTFLVKGIKDTQCGFKLFKRSALKLFEKQTRKGWSFDFEILFLAQKYNLKIKELPVIWKANSESRVKIIDYFKTLVDLFIIRFNNFLNKY